VLGLGKAEYLRRVVFPSSLTHIFSGMSVGLAMSFIMLTVAELFGANAGLGRFVQFYADFADYPRMVARHSVHWRRDLRLHAHARPGQAPRSVLAKVDCMSQEEASLLNRLSDRRAGHGRN